LDDLRDGELGSWVRLAAGDAWGFYLFDHQYYFSPVSLESLVRRAGLVDFRLLPEAHVAPPAAPAPDDDAAVIAAWEAYRRGTELWPGHAGSISSSARRASPERIADARVPQAVLGKAERR